MNATERFESFLLGEGDKKIEETAVANMANASDFIIKKEDHTTGNLIAQYLGKHKHVTFAGYKVPHPNVPELFVRVQTDGARTPRDALNDVFNHLLNMLQKLDNNVTREFELRRVAGVQKKGNQGSGEEKGQGEQGAEEKGETVQGMGQDA